MHKHHSTQSLIDKADELKQQLNHFPFQLQGVPLYPSYHCSNQTQWMMRVFPLSYSLNLLLCLDRKSTRLNSSHVSISYAVFCLKKKIHTSVSYYYTIRL